jgi:hypothetical protein
MMIASNVQKQLARSKRAHYNRLRDTGLANCIAVPKIATLVEKK